MDIDSIGVGAGGGGLIGVVLTWLGLKSKLSDMDKNHNKLEERFEEHTKNVISLPTFNATITPMKEDIKEIKDDVKLLLERSLQRRNGDK